MHSRSVLLCVAWLVGALAMSSAQAERRALVIGNDAYVSVDPLRNAVADARAMAKALEKVGFKVAPPVLNADRERMLDAIARFAETLGGSDEAVVFYAGHAVEMKGVNYLLPVDIRSDNERSVQFNAIPLNYLLSSVADQKLKFSLMVIDACRDNPFKGSGRNVSSRGLVPAAAAAQGQMVMYSASEGQKALDRLGPDDKSPNGVFTRVFVKVIEEEGVHAGELMERVKEEVHRLAQSVQHEQLPAFYNAAVGRFYFRGSATSTRRPEDSSARADEDTAAFDAAKSSDVVEAYQAYLDAFPKGRFAAAARIRMAALRKGATPAAAPSVPENVRPGRELEDCSGCPKLVVIPGGSFDMGSPADEPDRQDREGPQRTVQISAFAMGRTEVTRGEYHRFARETGRSATGCYEYDGKDWKLIRALGWENPGYEQFDDHPVVCVDWDDVQAYLQWLSKRSGQTYRQASEAEWEYAARAGKSTARHWGDGENEACRFANGADQSARRKFNWGLPLFGCDDGYANTAPAASYRANDFGLHDMMGNVWEWTEDCWNDTYRGAPSSGTPWTEGDCSRRVARGGSWVNDPAYARSANRDWNRASLRNKHLGFRVVRTLP
jgi:formylglycine-generating enzyme required for sulfatase activity